MYVEKTYPVSQLLEEALNDKTDWEAKMKKMEEERAARVRILKALPQDITIRGIHMYPLYGSEASIHINLDGDADEVSEKMLELFEKLPPIPAEKISASCTWKQPKDHREPSEEKRGVYESAHTKIIPICPVWARADHVVKNSRSSLEFQWFVKVTDIIEDDQGTHADGGDILLRIDVKILQERNWVQYKYTTGHSRGMNDITVGSQTVSFVFENARPQIMGRGSSSQTWAMDFTWDDTHKPEDVLKRATQWRTKEKSSRY